jgi:hypothetical protein
VYDNTSNDLVTRFDPGLFEVGDQVILGGADRSITNFTLEYYGTSAFPPLFGGNVEVKVAFYANDGDVFNGYASPNTLLWESTWFPLLSATPRNNLVYSAGVDMPAEGVSVSDSFTWSIQFRGLGAGDSAGVDIFSPPTIGQNYPDYWQKSDTGWALLTNTVPMDFAARMEAATIPEPTTLTLTVLGGFGLLFLSRRFRKS